MHRAMAPGRLQHKLGKAFFLPASCTATRLDTASPLSRTGAAPLSLQRQRELRGQQRVELRGQIVQRAVIHDDVIGAHGPEIFASV